MKQLISQQKTQIFKIFKIFKIFESTTQFKVRSSSEHTKVSWNNDSLFKISIDYIVPECGLPATVQSGFKHGRN